MIGDSFLAQRLFLSVNWILPEFWIVLSLCGSRYYNCGLRPRVLGFGLSLSIGWISPVFADLDYRCVEHVLRLRIGVSPLFGVFFVITIDLIAVLVTLTSVLWTAIAVQTEDMWRVGQDEFNAAKISRIEAHLKERGGSG